MMCGWKSTLTINKEPTQKEGDWLKIELAQRLSMRLEMSLKFLANSFMCDNEMSVLKQMD